MVKITPVGGASWTATIDFKSRILDAVIPLIQEELALRMPSHMADEVTPVVTKTPTNEIQIEMEGMRPQADLIGNEEDPIKDAVNAAMERVPEAIDSAREVVTGKSLPDPDPRSLK